MTTSRILAASIRLPRAGYSNPPDLLVEIEDAPDFTYEVLPRPDGRTFYFAETDGFCSFYVHNPHAETGFGGSTFPLTLKTGEVRDVKGPWSSRSSVMNDLFPHSKEVTVRLRTPGYRTSYSLLIPTYREVLAAHCPDWVLERDETDSETSYALRKGALARLGDD